MNVAIGNKELELGGQYLTYGLRDSSDIKDDADALRQRFADDGYLYIKGLHDRAVVEQSRRSILEHMRDEGDMIAPDSDLMDAVVNPEPAPEKQGKVRLSGAKGIAAHPDFKAVIEGRAIFDLFERYHGEPCLTFNYKWLRAVGPGGGTGVHYDFVYMGQGSTRLMTCWTPLGDIPIAQGTLAICKGSHNEPGFERLRNTYGKLDVDKDLIPGWFTTDPIEIIDKFGGQWITTDFEMGDVVILGMHTMHMSTVNTTNQWRLSCDTRFQPAADETDPRWVGDAPEAHARSAGRQPAKTIDEWKAEWGV